MSEEDNILRRGMLKPSQRVWDSLFENNHLDPVRDGMLVLLLIETFEEYKILKNHLKKSRDKNAPDPRVHENSNGTVQSSPYVNQMKDVRTELRRQITELGLSPLAAAKLKTLDNSDRDTIIALLERDR